MNRRTPWGRLDWDAVITKVAKYKPRARTEGKKWADVTGA